MVTTREEKICKWGSGSYFFFFFLCLVLFSTFRKKGADFLRNIGILRVRWKMCTAH